MQNKGDPQRLLGPKAFPFERLLAIYDCIRSEDMQADTDSSVHSQLSTLLSMRLVARTTLKADQGMDNLHGTKLKANVTWDVVERLGKKIGFDVAQHMWDHES